MNTVKPSLGIKGFRPLESSFLLLRFAPCTDPATGSRLTTSHAGWATQHLMQPLVLKTCRVDRGVGGYLTSTSQPLPGENLRRGKRSLSAVRLRWRNFTPLVYKQTFYRRKLSSHNRTYRNIVQPAFYHFGVRLAIHSDILFPSRRCCSRLSTRRHNPAGVRLGILGGSV